MGSSQFDNFLKGRRSQVVKAAVCKTAIHRFESGRRLHPFTKEDSIFFKRGKCNPLKAGVAEQADAADLKF